MLIVVALVLVKVVAVLHTGGEGVAIEELPVGFNFASPPLAATSVPIQHQEWRVSHIGHIEGINTIVTIAIERQPGRQLDLIGKLTLIS